jgi:hypothetical protein
MRLISVLFVAIAACTTANAQDGGVIVRIPDGITSTCIAQSDQVYLTLRRLITTRREGWLREDKSIGILINAAAIAGDGKRTNFPLLSEVKIQAYREGQVSVPIEYVIVSGMPLKQQQTLYSGLQIDLTLLNKQSRTAWGKGLEALAEVSKKLPIPSNPATGAATYLLDFANKAIDKEIEAQNADDKAKSATMALAFDPTGKCAGGAGRDWERTGTIAVVQAAGTKGPGYVDIGRINEQCWTAELTPAFVLKSSPREAGKACNAPDYKPNYQQVMNNYTGFFVNAIPTSVTLGSREEAENIALKRCAAHGIAARECLGR